MLETPNSIKLLKSFVESPNLVVKMPRRLAVHTQRQTRDLVLHMRENGPRHICQFIWLGPPLLFDPPHVPPAVGYLYEFIHS
jgi:hypothetical protein